MAKLNINSPDIPEGWVLEGSENDSEKRPLGGEDTLSDQANRKLSLGFGGLNLGVGGALDILPQLTDATIYEGLRALGLNIPRPASFRQQIKDIGLGGGSVKPETAIERGIAYGGEIIGGEIPFFLMPYLSALKRTQAGRGFLGGMSGPLSAEAKMLAPKNVYEELLKTGVSEKVARKGQQAATMFFSKPKFAKTTPYMKGFGKKERMKGMAGYLADFAAQTKAMPLRTLTQEGKWMALSGLGGGAAVELYPDNQAAEIAGQVAGPAVVSLAGLALRAKYLPFGLLRQGAGKVKSVLADKFGITTDAAQSLREDAIEKSLAPLRETLEDPALRKSLVKGKETEELVGQYTAKYDDEGKLIGKPIKTTTAERTLLGKDVAASEVLMKEQTDLVARMRGDALTAEKKRLAANADALSRFPDEFQALNFTQPYMKFISSLRRGIQEKIKPFAKVVTEKSKSLEIPSKKLKQLNKLTTREQAVIGNRLRKAAQESHHQAIMDFRTRAKTEYGIDDDTLRRISIKTDGLLDKKRILEAIEEIVDLKFEKNPAGKRLAIAAHNKALSEGKTFLPWIPKFSKKGPITFYDAKVLRDVIGREISGVKEPATIKALSSAQVTIDDLLEDAMQTQIVHDKAGKWKSFREDYNEGVHNLYTNYAPYERITRTKRGSLDNFVTLPEKVAEAYIGPPNKKALYRDGAQFNEIYGNSLDDELESIMFHQMAEMTAPAGTTTINEKKIAKYIELKQDFMRGNKLDPEKFKNIENIAKTMQKDMQRSTKKIQQIENAAVMNKISPLLKGTGAQGKGPPTPQDLKAFFNKVINTPTLARRITTQELKGDPIALNGFRRLVWEGIDWQNADTLIKTLDNPIQSKSLSVIFTKKHLEGIQAFTHFDQMTRSSTAQGQVTVPDSVFNWTEKYFGKSFKEFINKIWQFRTKVVPERHIIADFGTSFAYTADRKAKDKIIKSMLYDEVIAENLMDTMEVGGKSIAEKLKAFRNFKLGLVNLGIISRTSDWIEKGERDNFIENAKNVNKIVSSPIIQKQLKDINKFQGNPFPSTNPELYNFQRKQRTQKPFDPTESFRMSIR